MFKSLCFRTTFVSFFLFLKIFLVLKLLFVHLITMDIYKILSSVRHVKIVDKRTGSPGIKDTLLIDSRERAFEG